MTQNEIKELLQPIEEKYQAVRLRLESLKKENFANAELYKQCQENLLGQEWAYQFSIMSLQSKIMNLAFAELQNK